MTNIGFRAAGKVLEGKSDSLANSATRLWIASPTKMDAMILNEEGSRHPRQVRRARGMAEYLDQMQALNAKAAGVYRYMNFDQIAEFKEVADMVTV